MEVLIGLAILAGLLYGVVRFLVWIVNGLIGFIREIGGSTSPRVERCKLCGGPIHRVSRCCSLCGHYQAAKSSKPINLELQTTLGMLQRLLEAGELSTAEHTELIGKLKRQWAKEQGLPAVVVSPKPPMPQSGPQPKSEPLPKSEVEPSTKPTTQPITEVQPTDRSPVLDEKNWQPALAKPRRVTPPPLPPVVAPLAMQKTPASKLGTFIEAMTCGPTESPAAVTAIVLAEVEQPIVPPEPKVELPPPKPKRPLTDIFRSFMEEKNIRWGELVSGMLIVGCSVGLVVSLWTTLEGIPYFPVLLFLAVTAALHGAGLYTLKRWKLESVSQTLIVIAQMLTPLNFLTLLALSRKMKAGDPLVVGGTIVESIAFAAICWSAGRSLFIEWPRILMVGVLAISASQVLISRRLADDASNGLLLAIGCVPLLGYLVTGGWMHWRASRWTEFTEKRLAELFIALGLATFAVVLADGLIAYKVGDVMVATNRLSPILGLTALPFLALGLLLHRRLNDPNLAAARTTGTALAMLGVAVLMAVHGFAWPDPNRLVIAGLVNFAVLTMLAFWSRIALMHWSALLSLAVAYLVGIQNARGWLSADPDGLSDQLLGRLSSGESALALAPFATAVAGVSMLLRSRGRSDDARQYLKSSGILAIVAVAIAGYSGFWTGVDVNLATPVFAIAAAVLFAMNLGMRRAIFGWSSSALLLVAMLHGLAYNSAVRAWLIQTFDVPPDRPILAALLLHATVATVIAVVASWRYRVRASDDSPAKAMWNGCDRPFAWSATLSVLTTLAWLPQFNESELSQAAFILANAMVVWLLAGWCLQSAGWLRAAQVVAVPTVICAVTAICQRQVWWRDLSASVLDIRHLHFQCIGLLIYGIAWPATRFFFGKFAAAEDLFRRASLGLDRALIAISLFATLVSSSIALIPAIERELGFAASYALPVVHPSAQWLLIASVGLTATIFWFRPTMFRGFAVVGALAQAPLLAALHASDQTAAGTALRFSSVGLALAIAAATWTRRPLTRLLNRLACPLSEELSEKLAAALRMCAVAIAGVPVIAISMLAILQVAQTPDQGGTRPALALVQFDQMWSYGLPILLLSGMLFVNALRDRLTDNGIASGIGVAFAIVTMTFLSESRPLGLLAMWEGARLAEWIAISAAALGLLWLLIARRLQPANAQPAAEFESTLQRRVGFPRAVYHFEAAVAVMALGVVALPALLQIWVGVERVGAMWQVVEQLGRPYGWLALIGVFGVGVAIFVAEGSNEGARLMALTTLIAPVVLGGMLAANGFGPTTVFRVVLFCWPILSLGLIGLGWQTHWRRLKSDEIFFASIAGCAIGLAHALAGAFGARTQFECAIAGFLIAACMIAQAVWQRHEFLVLLAGLVGNASASLLTWCVHYETRHEDWSILLLQVNVASAATLALIWLALERRFSASGQLWLRTQIAAVAVGAILLVAQPLIAIVLWPNDASQNVQAFGQLWGFAAMALAALATTGFRWAPAILRSHSFDTAAIAESTTSDDKAKLTSFPQAVRRHWRWCVDWIATLSVMAIVLFAARNHPIQEPTQWLSYHWLTGGWLVVACLSLAAAWTYSISLNRPGANIAEPKFEGVFAVLERWTLGVGGAVVLLGVRAAWEDPARPWWPLAATGGVAIVVALLALLSRLQFHAYLSAFLAALSTKVFWIAIGDADPTKDWLPFVLTETMVVAAVGVFWLGVEVYFQRRKNQSFDLSNRSTMVHHAVAALTLGTLSVLAFVDIQSHFNGNAEYTSLFASATTVGCWGAVAAIAILSIGLCWDRQARNVSAAIYLLGLNALVIGVSRNVTGNRDYCFWIATHLCTQVLLAGVLWAARSRCVRLAASLRITTSNDDLSSVWKWLPITQLLLAAVALVIETWASLTLESTSHRILGGLAANLLAPALAMSLFGPDPEHSRDTKSPRLGAVALTLGAWAAVVFGWSLMAPTHEPVLWLHRSIRLMVVLGAATFALGFGLTRLLRNSQSWYKAAHSAGVVVGLGAIASLGVALAMEASWFHPDPSNPTRIGAPVNAIQIVLVAAAFVGLVAVAIRFAILPGADPLGLSESGRMAYVFTSEVLLALLFVHCKLTMPAFFPGIWERFWPFILMIVAFAGVGLSEFFRRTGHRVLAEPLERTGAFLPLLPAIGFWIYSSQTNYSAVLFVVGLLYAILSMARKSFVFGMAAALAGNGALWVLLRDRGATILYHPQLWLIPPAMSVLAAAHINRDRLKEAQLTAIRYLCVMVIYVSSTADIFLTSAGGREPNLLMPIALAALSVVGVLSGIALKVRAFLYLGSAFLLLSMVTMVWQSAHQIGHVWPWWAFGIVLGSAILTLFGVFEKKRNEVLAVVRDLKDWQA